MTHAGGADFSLLQDGDDAYIAYGSWHNYKIRTGWKADWYPEWAREGHQIAVQRLDPATFARADPAGPPAVTVVSRPSTRNGLETSRMTCSSHFGLLCYARCRRRPALKSRLLFSAEAAIIISSLVTYAAFAKPGLTPKSWSHAKVPLDRLC